MSSCGPGGHENRRSTAISVLSAGVRITSPSGQPECGHLLAVAHEEGTAGDDGMVPGLAGDARRAAEFLEPFRRRADKRQLSFFRQHEQRIVVRQQHKLAAAVAAALPLPRAVRQVDAREDGAVEAERVPLVNDEVVEPWLEAIRGPALADRPSAAGAA